ncbi:hypothetical protein NDU88_000830 [Pleurodeles waltl]|uniref:Uncharacterized protein n=1 Tax=Pleurodeles waltl TaxID=8319 RepID=A0AAV7UU84_PLEWA|nr:hypothetical protein NDU88_000830 [Pleurodeles waltl]
MTSLTRYLECKRKPRGLQNVLLPTYEDMDDDLVKEWCENTEECSARVMKTLTKHAKRKMKQRSAKVELINKELEKYKEYMAVKELLTKMEKNLQEYDEEIMERKARKFTRGRLDDQYSCISSFAKKFDSLRTKEKMTDCL